MMDDNVEAAALITTSWKLTPPLPQDESYLSSSQDGRYAVDAVLDIKRSDQSQLILHYFPL